MPLTIDQFLALLTVDEATATTVVGQYVILQRDPQPDEIDIATDTDLALRLVDLDQDTGGAPSVLFADFDVFVESTKVLSFVSGTPTFFAGWTGTATLSTLADPYVYVDVALTPPAPFVSEQVVDVQLDILPSVATFNYSFTIEDLTPPRLLTAETIAPETLRVTFDDAMATSGAGSVLALGNWPSSAIVTQNVDPMPGVDLEVIAVAEVDGSAGAQFDLTLQWEMTPGCPYTVTAAATIEDSSGNAMDPDYASATFLGFQPDVPAGRFFNYWFQCVPLKNRQEDVTHDLERTANCFQEIIDLLLQEIDHHTDQYDPDRMDIVHNTLALWDMGNPFDVEKLGLTKLQQRKLLRFLLPIYQSKGTDVGIEQAILFLLGLSVTVVPYLGEGWILGVDLLGSGEIAQLMNGAAAPYDFTLVTSPWTLEVVVNEGSTQTVTFVPGDFDDPSAATAAEVVAALEAALTGAGAYVIMPGQPAVVTGTAVETYVISPGDTIDLIVQGLPYTVQFTASDIASPTAATLDEVIARVNLDMVGLVVASDDSTGRLRLETVERSDAASLQVGAGSAQAALGLPTTPAAGSDQPQMVLYSDTAGRGAAIQVTGGNANVVLQFDTDASGAAEGSVLAPSDSYTRYSFDIETATVLSSEHEELVRDIAEYMKPAHTHLVNIRTALPLPWPPGWYLGVGGLGDDAELGA